MTSLALRTDLLVDPIEVERREGHLVLRLRSEPDYWFGNAVVVPGGTPIPEAERLFAAAHPNATHRVVIFDPPEMPETVPEGWEVEEEAILTASSLMPGPPPNGYEIRAIEGEADWGAVLGLRRAVDAEEGQEGPSHDRFLAGRVASMRAVAETGRGVRMGAFRDGELAASAGIAWDEEVARYQLVETASDHRRRGLAAALVGACATHAPGRLLVIAAEIGGGAKRLYRRLGFEEAERAMAVVRPGY